MNAVTFQSPHTLPVDELIHQHLPAAARGDQHAYGRIVAACQNTVTAIALAMTRDVAASEDIAQEAFLSAWQHLKRLHNPASFLPWLRQITRNLARDYLRGRRHRLIDGERAELAIALAADPSASPMQQLLDKEQESIAAELISELPDESREVLLLYYREGQSSRQVADLLGLSDAAVRKRLSRARRSVREDLLRRVGEFARGSAPTLAFALTVTSTLGGIAKPAAAAGMATASSSMAIGLFGKSLLGSFAAAGGGLFTGALVAWFCRNLLARYADDESERLAILKTYDAYLLIPSAVMIVGLIVYWLTESPLPMFAAVIASLAVINYQMLVALPRVMDPLLARDAARHPQGAERRQLLYRLTFGVSGTLISTISVLGLLVIVYLQRA